MSWAWSSPTKFSSKLPSDLPPAARRRVSVFGAPGTGAQALAEHLQALLRDHPSLEISCPTSPEARCELALLTGLPPTTRSPEARATQLQVDTALRAQLQVLARPFRVVYGEGDEQLNNALLALGLSADSAVQARRAQAQFDLNRGRTPWSCEKCSDPDCEHRLFTGLLARR